jgi:hypothetical protein
MNSYPLLILALLTGVGAMGGFALILMGYRMTSSSSTLPCTATTGTIVSSWESTESKYNPVHTSEHSVRDIVIAIRLLLHGECGRNAPTTGTAMPTRVPMMLTTSFRLMSSNLL